MADFSEIVRALVEDPAFLRTFTERMNARAVDQQTVERLIAYARDRQATRGQAVARRVLTDAGVSWESP
jgi:hypothetical protein